MSFSVAPTSLPITVPEIPDGPLPAWLADVVAKILLRQVDRDDAEHAEKVEAGA